MRWDYDPKWRDMFDDGVHRDILIVPHATKVTKVPGGPPRVQSKVPKFYLDNDPDRTHHIDNDLTKEGKRIPNEYEDVEWTITNENLYQEKFEFADALCSNEKLTFGSCEAAMVKFTIRNSKTYNEETERYELDIPDLQKIQVTTEDGKQLLGELQGAAIINVWTYVNGDSDSLMWLGMYKVEQDKVSGDKYQREIIAYDFMLTFRDMDIFEWYKALFEGVPMDSDDPSKGKNDRWPKADEWTIGEALKYLFDNLAFSSPGKPTITNPKEYLMDMDADKYPGYGMPIVIDPDIWDMTLPAIQFPAEDEEDPTKLYERYGGMKIMDLPFRKDEKIIKKGALSCGKFLEDIASLAGRFGYIRKDKFVDDNYVDPDPTARHRYNTYEKCYLTFRPLPSSEDATIENGKIRSENYFDNSDVEKGIQYEYYDVREVKIIDLYDYDNNRLFYYCPSGLKASTKSEWEKGNRTELNVFTISENMFTSYLKKSDTNNKFVIDLLKEGKSVTRQVPDYFASVDRENPSTTPVMKTVTYDGTALLKPCFNSAKNRPYRPYQLSTSSDLCRMPGDIIRVKGVDRITGETYEFTSFILVRRCTGIQKQMDKYTAKGDSYTGTYSDYRSGELNDSFHPQSMGYCKVSSGSGNTNGATVIEGLTEENLIEILRNDGRRFLDEPSDVSAVYDPTNGKVILKWTDPQDLTDWKPHPCEWEGTVVIRSEGSRPLSRYGGEKIVKSTTRDEYAINGFEDDTVESGKHYFYCFMPYYTLLNDEEHNIYCYRWTKVVEVNTDYIMTAPEITKLSLDGVTTVTVEYIVPSLSTGSYEYCKLVVKKDSMPEGSEDGDKIIDINPSLTSIDVESLDELSTYYFVIFIEDNQGKTASSEPKSCITSADEGYNFAYTGAIQTFTAPKTGIYQLETWGAQGGDATDGTLTARGGYGAYAVGEVFLTQGETLYINVGGQNGYGGGGNFIPSDLSYIENINNIWIRGYNSKPAINFFDTYNYTFRQGYGSFPVVSILGNPEEHTFTFSDLSTHRSVEEAMAETDALQLNAYGDIITITVTESNGSVNVEYSSNYTPSNEMKFFSSTPDCRFNLNYGSISSDTNAIAVGSGSWAITHYNQSSFTDLASAIEYIYLHFTNINLIVNGMQWISAR